MRNEIEYLILNNGGEIITLNLCAPIYEPILEFIYKDIFFSIGEDEDENWECHYHSILNDEIEIDTIDWDWELIDIVQTYMLWADDYYEM